MNFLELPLFQSLSDQELEQMKTSGCLRTASYKKNDIIFSTGSTVSEIGIVLSGSVNVENIDFWGNKSILGNMNEGHIFAETYALCREPIDGRCRCRQQLRNSFFESESFTGKKLHFFLVFENTTQPSYNVQPQKFDALRTDFLHFFKNSSQPTADLSVRTVPETQQPSFSDSVRPTANGRLPESGSQCPVKRTFPYEKRRDLRFSQKRICFKK